MREFSPMRPGTRTVQLEMALACEVTPLPPSCASGSAWAVRHAIIGIYVFKEILSPCSWCWLQNAPMCSFFFFFFGNKPADPLGESWRNTWKLDKCHRHCDPQPGCLCPSPICALLALSFPEGGDDQTKNTLSSCGKWSQPLPRHRLVPKGNIQYVYWQNSNFNKKTRWHSCIFSQEVLLTYCFSPMAILCHFKQIIYLLLSGASY